MLEHCAHPRQPPSTKKGPNHVEARSEDSAAGIALKGFRELVAMMDEALDENGYVA